MKIPETIEVNGKNFSIKKLLGKGKGGYSYLAEKDGKNYTLKQIHHEPCDYFQFGNKIEAESRDYQRLLEAGINIPKLYEIDFEKEIVLKEFIDGEDIVSLVKNNRMKDEYLSQAREMAKKINEKGLNLDYYPTNFIVQDKNAKRMTITVYERNIKSKPKNETIRDKSVQKLDELIIDNLPDSDSNLIVTITFTANKDGSLKLSADIKSNGKVISKEHTIEKESNLL